LSSMWQSHLSGHEQSAAISRYKINELEIASSLRSSQ